MSRRSVVVVLLLAALALAAMAPAPATAAEVPPGTYYVNVVGGTVHVGTPSPMDFLFSPAVLGQMDVPAGDQVPIRLPVAGQSLNPVTSQTAFGPVTFTVTFTEDLIGTLTRATGELTIHNRLMVSDQVGGPTGFTCLQGSPAEPIVLELSSEPPGEALDAALGAVVADDRFALPALRDCTGIDTALANGTAGFPVAAGGNRAKMMISLVNAATTTEAPLTTPAPAPSPGGTLPPPVTGVTPRMTIAGSTAAVRNGAASLRLRCVAAARQCAGRLQLLPTAAGTALSKPVAFSIATGRTAAVRVKLRRAALTSLRRRGSLKARAVATVDGATKPITRRIVLRAPTASR